MPVSKSELVTKQGFQEARDAVLKALASKGYRIEQDLQNQIVAKHPLSATYYPHAVEVYINAEPGKTTIQASIDHRRSQAYTEELREEIAKNLQPLPRVVFTSTQPPTSQEQLNRQAALVNPNFNRDEQVLWSHRVIKGVFHKEIVEEWIITGLRAIKKYPVTKENPQERFISISLSDADVVVMRQHRETNGHRVGTFAGTTGGGFFTGTTTGVTHSTGITYGDLVFLQDKKEIIRFSGISDPQDINRMIQTIKKEKTSV